MTKRQTIIYNIVTFLTVALPIPIYLIVMACVFSIEPDVTIKPYSDTINVIEVAADNYFIYGGEKTEFASGYIIYHEGHFGALVTTSDVIIKIDRDYVNIQKTEDGTISLIEYKNQLFQKQLTYKFPIAIIISLIGVGIVALILTKKMGIVKKRPRTAALISLSVGTLILIVIDVIVGSLLGVFVVATAAWAAYCIEYAVYNKDKLFKKSNDTNNELVSALDSFLERYNR